MAEWILGQEAIHATYGLGRVTKIVPGAANTLKIGFTPFVAGYEMLFDEHNIKRVTASEGESHPVRNARIMLEEAGSPEAVKAYDEAMRALHRFAGVSKGLGYDVVEHFVGFNRKAMDRIAREGRDAVAKSRDKSGCAHPIEQRGSSRPSGSVFFAGIAVPHDPSIGEWPLRYGSSEVQVCKACGSYRISHDGSPYAWKPGPYAPALAAWIAEIGDDD